MSEVPDFDWDAWPREVQPESRYWTGDVTRTLDGREHRLQLTSFVLPNVEVELSV